VRPLPKKEFKQKGEQTMYKRLIVSKGSLNKDEGNLWEGSVNHHSGLRMAKLLDFLPNLDPSQE
jgi:hypothetical protein